MTAETTAAFPVVWDDPADAERTWQYDPVHMPNAVRPLEFDLGMRPLLEGFGWGMHPRLINSYIYYYFRPEPGAQPQTATNERVREGARRWHEEVLPEVLALTERYRHTDFASMTNEALAGEVERLPELRFRSGRLHTLSITPHFQGMSILIETYRRLTGGDELGAVRLVQGDGNKSFESGERLWRVSRVAAGIPPVRDRLLAVTDQNALDTLAALRALSDAAPFVEAFDAYLEEYGWRGGFATPTWAEDPMVPLTLLRSHLEAEGYDPAAEHRRLADEREAAARDALAGLDGDARGELQEAIDAARAVSMLSEDHNFYIDQRLWTMPRRLLTVAAARLDALADPNDVFFLTGDELVTALRGADVDAGSIAAQRKREFERWSAVTPPRYVGVVPEGRDGAAPAGAAREPARAEGLRGLGVSAGVARGPARVVLGLHEAGRVQRGDVLVTNVTQPAWTPLFAVAGAVVTEVGGMLAHTAIAAREYGLPAVVAVPDATRRIPDGRLVEVDGAAGTVRLL